MLVTAVTFLTARQPEMAPQPRPIVSVQGSLIVQSLYFPKLVRVATGRH